MHGGSTHWTLPIHTTFIDFDCIKKKKSTKHKNKFFFFIEMITDYLQTIKFTQSEVNSLQCLFKFSLTMGRSSFILCTMEPSQSRYLGCVTVQMVIVKFMRFPGRWGTHIVFVFLFLFPTKTFFFFFLLSKSFSKLNW